jgi:hypothetical protein
MGWSKTDTVQSGKQILLSRQENTRLTEPGLYGKSRMSASLKHLAVKDLVLFFTWRTSRADTTSHEQGGSDRD